MTSTRKVAVPVAGSRIWTNGSLGCDAVRDLQVLRVVCDHLAPGGGRGKAVFETKLGLQEFMDAADDVGDDGLRGVEDAALHAFLARRIP